VERAALSAAMSLALGVVERRLIVRARRAA
jgi:hypothetical protein